MSATALRIRRVIASAASLAVAVRFYLLLDGDYGTAQRVFFGATIAIPFVAGMLIWSGRLAAQLLARGAWWSMLLGGCLLAVTGHHDEALQGAYLAIPMGVALLAAGQGGLDNRERFAPAAFRGTLLLALILAMADAGAFLWFGSGNAVFLQSWSVLMMTPPMIAGVIGLMRLRTWGLIVSLATNLAIAILALTDVLNLVSPLRQLFIGSALLQMLVPLPMLVSIIRGRTPNPDAWRRTRTLAPMVIVFAAVALSVYAAFFHDGRLLRLGSL